MTRCEQGRGFRLTRSSCQTSKLATRLTALRICTGTWLPALLMVTDRTAFLQNAAHILGCLRGYVDADGAGGFISTAAPDSSCRTHFLFFKRLLIREGGEWGGNGGAHSSGLGDGSLRVNRCKVLLLCFQAYLKRDKE